ncbi:MAG: lipid droplet-associated protein [Mycobacterium sp.]
MSSAPYGVRLIIGATATAVEETLRLPQTILAFPMTVVSQLASMVMKMQQDLADLVIKGDETLESLFPPKDEQPEWATFDEDQGDLDFPSATLPTDGTRLTEGRFALYSDIPIDTQAGASEATGNTGGATGKATAKNNGTTITAEVPEIAEELDYASLTLAQLRARLTSLKLADLEALLTYENLTKARAPFQTLLSNRITRATAK